MNTKVIALVCFLFAAKLTAQVDPFIYVNSPADEMNPVLTEGGNQLYFIRVYDAQNSMGMRDPGDIWKSVMTDSAVWSPAVRLPVPLNNPQFNGVVGFDPGGDQMYLYEHYMPGGQPARTQGLSVSGKRGDNWTDPVRLDIKYFYNRSDHVSISLSPDGNVMLLALESYGSLGAEDIYVSFKNGNEWTEPKNIGAPVNTRFQEMTPYLASDNATMFFASNGHGGFGGRDIFVTTRLDDTWRNWSVPVNLGSGVNTEGVELYFQYFPEEEKAIYTSTQNSDGYSDLRMVFFPKDELEEIIRKELDFSRPEVAVIENMETEKDDQEAKIPNLFFTGWVKDAGDDHPIAATLHVKGPDWEDTFIADSINGFQITLPVQDVFQITVESDGYVSIQEALDVRITDVATVQHDFQLQRIAVGTTVKLNNVLFVRGSTELLESSYDELDLVVKMMNENPEMEISLAGHTDNQGNARLNRILSQQRVETVMDYLSAHGIDRFRISGKGFGGSQPVASNDSEETRRLNRRVEFTIEKN